MSRDDSPRERKKGGGGMKHSGKIQPPDQRAFEREINAVSREIKEKQSKLPVMRLSDQDISSELSRIATELGEINGKKTSNTSEVRRIEERVRSLGSEVIQKKDEASKLVAGLRHKTEERIDEVVSKLEQQLQTKQFPATEERKLQTEIDSLQRSKERLKEYLAKKEEIDRMRAEQEQLRKRRDSLYRINRDLRTQETDLKDCQAEYRQQQEERKEKHREAIAVKDALTKEIDELFQRRQQLRNEFRRQQVAYLDATREEREAERVQREEDRKARGEARRRKQVAEVELQRDLLYEEEKGVCRALLSYLQKLSLSPPIEGTHGSTEQHAGATPPSKVHDDGMIVLRRREQDAVLLPASHPSGRRRSRKDKKRSSPGVSKVPKLLNHNAAIFSQFSSLGLSPPTAYSDVPFALTQLQEKLAFYESKSVARKADSEAGDSGVGSTGFVEPFDSEHELTSQDDLDLIGLSPKRTSVDEKFADPSSLKLMPQASLSSGSGNTSSTNSLSSNQPASRSSSSVTVSSNGSEE